MVNKLTLSLTAADDGLTYTCKAFNSALQKDVRQSVTLRVNCKYKSTFVSFILTWTLFLLLWKEKQENALVMIPVRRK